MMHESKVGPFLSPNDVSRCMEAESVKMCRMPESDSAARVVEEVNEPS